MRPANHVERPIAAMFGGPVWVLLLGVSIAGRLRLGIIDLIFLLAPLVIVPLGLGLVAPPRSVPHPDPLYLWARLLQPYGAALVVASYCLPPGIPAALLASGWFMACSLIGLCGLLRIWRDGFESVERICSNIGLLYLPIGGAWLGASRFGATPMGFEEPIVLLTAVHFHYSGFAAPLLVGATGRALGPSSGVKRRILNFVGWGVLVAPAMLALGFVISPVLKILSAFILTASLMGLSVLTFETLLLVGSKTARTFLAISSFAVPAGMMLACVYAVGDFTGHELISIPQMALFHGITNSVGFALCGLLAWSMVAREKSTKGTTDVAQSATAQMESQRP